MKVEKLSKLLTFITIIVLVIGITLMFTDGEIAGAIILSILTLAMTIMFIDGMIFHPERYEWGPRNTDGDL